MAHPKFCISTHLQASSLHNGKVNPNLLGSFGTNPYWSVPTDFSCLMLSQFSTFFNLGIPRTFRSIYLLFCSLVSLIKVNFKTEKFAGATCSLKHALDTNVL